MKRLIKRLFDAFTQPMKTEREKKYISNPSPFTWLMPSLTSRFFFMSMFLYLLWLPTKGSLAVSVISFVLNLYLSLLASCMGRGNSISCFSFSHDRVVATVQWNLLHWDRSTRLGCGFYFLNGLLVSCQLTCFYPMRIVLCSSYN